MQWLLEERCSPTMEDSMQSGIQNQEDYKDNIPIKGIIHQHLSAITVPARGIGFRIEEEKSKKSKLRNKPYNFEFICFFARE